MGSAVAGIAGSLISGRSASKAAKSAAAAQERAQQAAIGEQRRQFDITQQQLDPFYQASLPALNLQLALMGLPQIGASAGGVPASGAPTSAAVTPSASASLPDLLKGDVFGFLADRINQGAETPQQAMTPQTALAGQIPQFTREQALATLQESPGQAFLRERQQQALLRQSAAIGGLGGGNVRTALQQQAAGFAQQDLQNQLQRLAQLSAAGQAAATQTGQFGAGAAGAIGQSLIGAGQARAGGILGAQQARAGTMEQLYTGLGSAFTQAPSISATPAFASYNIGT